MNMMIDMITIMTAGWQDYHQMRWCWWQRPQRRRPSFFSHCIGGDNDYDNVDEVVFVVFVNVVVVVDDDDGDDRDLIGGIPTVVFPIASLLLRHTLTSSRALKLCIWIKFTTHQYIRSMILMIMTMSRLAFDNGVNHNNKGQSHIYL